MNMDKVHIKSLRQKYKGFEEQVPKPPSVKPSPVPKPIPTESPSKSPAAKQAAPKKVPATTAKQTRPVAVSGTVKQPVPAPKYDQMTLSTPGRVGDRSTPLVPATTYGKVQSRSTQGQVGTPELPLLESEAATPEDIAYDHLQRAEDRLPPIQRLRAGRGELLTPPQVTGSPLVASRANTKPVPTAKGVGERPGTNEVAGFISEGLTNEQIAQRMSSHPAWNRLDFITKQRLIEKIRRRLNNG